MKPPPSITLSLRSAAGNDNHHLWNNHGTWWCHFTLHSSAGYKQRVRRSLKTANLATARRRRDALLARLGASLSASTERRFA
jgi:hypothetical protein